jgi:hypothetical protein
MRRLMILTVMLALLLSLVMASPRASRVVKAEDPCVDCIMGVEQRFEACQTALGPDAQICYDSYNYGVVLCYATVCDE